MEIEKLKDPLHAGQIEFKISMVTKTNTNVWASILAYKDARTDMEVLDDTCGQFNWQSEYQRDSKGVLQCTVSIWDEEKQQWISKTSNGTPSEYEGEKGEYSDAFKRAGFMWGIGRQLYDFPAIWVQLSEGDYYTQEANGKVKYKASKKLRPNDWDWSVSEDYQSVVAKRKYGNTWKIIYNSNPYKKQDNE